MEKPGDTFLDLRPWGKGCVWVNGHNLGRYWNIGPQQTMYVPRPWLKPGRNEILILDLLGPEKPVIAALDKPILDQLRPEMDFARVKRPEATLKLDAAALIHAAQFASGTAMQRDARTARARTARRPLASDPPERMDSWECASGFGYSVSGISIEDLNTTRTRGDPDPDSDPEGGVYDGQGSDHLRG